MANGYATVSIFIIGTEITRGIIADRHGQLIAKELTTIGYHIHRITIVPDDGSIAPLLASCVKRSDIVILTGGLGPTSDDMTRQVVADIAGVPLIQDEEAFNRLYERLGERSYGANQRQVMFPAGFHVIENPKGTAPGFWGEITVEQQRLVRIYAMPGPPVEMHEMFYNKILPALTKLTGHEGVGRAEFSSFLTPEARLEDICNELSHAEILWGTRAQEHRISLYLNGSTAEKRSLMANQVGNRLGKGLIWEGDRQAVDILVDHLKEQQLKVVCAESCTGGFLGKLLTDEAGSSAWFWGSLVTYANEAKQKILGVPAQVIAEDGAVSQASVQKMAEGALKLSDADIAIAVSGIAGPEGGSEQKPVGSVWYGFAAPNKPTAAVEVRFSTYGRSSVRRRGSVAAFLLAYFYLKGADLLDIVSTWQYI
ncbi:MAG: nicotinamide-nucleotide amidohydrolase family protein [Sphaerochaetaceae bacterium]